MAIILLHNSKLFKVNFEKFLKQEFAEMQVTYH